MRIGIPVSSPAATAGERVSRPGGRGIDFSEELGRAVGEVDGLQAKAEVETGKLALGAGNLHEAAIAVEKADVAMRLMVRVRNRVVEAYQEVMRMGV